jgi:hypothetical protein
MYRLLLPPSANAQRHLDAPTVPLNVTWKHAVAALRTAVETLRGLVN